MKTTLVAGRRVSNMSLGTVQLGLNYGIANTEGKPEQQKSFAMLETALQNGVTSLDTARAYGDAEQVLGDFFRQRDGERPFITTKLDGSMPADISPAEVEKWMMASIEASLERLGVQKVDCLLLHRAADMEAYGTAVPDALRRIVREGYADIVGASVYYPHEVDTMLQNDIYQAIQVPMNLFDQRLIAGGQLNRLHERGICVFVRSVFLQGLFFMNPDTIEAPMLREHAAPHLKKLRALSEQADMSVGQFAASFIRDLPGVVSLVLGADNPQQVLDDIALLDGPAIPEGICSETKRVFAQVDYEGVMAELRKPKPQPSQS